MLKDLLVPLYGTPEDEVRLAYAESLAGTFDAHIGGLFVNILPIAMAAGEAYGGAGLAVELQNNALEHGNEIGAALARRFAALSGRNELRRIDALPGQAGITLAAEARTTDLVIMTRPYGEGGEPTLFESVLFGSGRSVLCVPPGGTPPATWDNVMIGWKNTRETARAVAEAMPFLRLAGRAAVAVVDEQDRDERRGEAGSDIARHLDRHGLDVDIRHVTEWKKISAALIEEAEKCGAQMMVMGGYGHSRFREWVMGGTTREILSSAPIPVLVAH